MLSVAAALVGLTLYYITKAPTVSFWDCGEFIATSYIMGIPHPPGNPLYVILGRLFTILPIDPTIAVRVNLISVISSAASIFVAFWLILRLAIGERSDPPAGKVRLGLGIGAFSGALIMGLSATYWSNAVEAEVYGLSMLLMLIITYVALIWARDPDRPGANKLLIFISYLLWLSLGIHMTTFILAIPLVIYLGFVDFTKSGFRRWPVWLVLSLFILYAVPLQTQLLSLFGIDISASELESFFVLLGIAFAVTVIMLVLSSLRNSESSRVWVLTLLIILGGAIGYSTQAFIPIRAAEKPSINENDPSNWPRFKSFLERKQYGQESMITRMFHRRGSWQNQFVSHPSFGLLSLLNQQFSSPEARLIMPVKGSGSDGSFGRAALGLSIIYVLFLGLGGIMESVKRSRLEGSFVVFTMLLCTVGLAFYLNFSDGTYNKTIAPLAEVRNRDYFYTPGFMYFGVLIGVGLAAFLEWMANFSSRASAAGKSWLKPAFAIAVAIALFLPLHTASANFDRNDRRGNFIPWDYAANILQSCAENAILFTNGDNDTFPLWFLQEVDHVRRDVRIVNLSLLNTQWYIHQLKNQMGVPINLSHDEIESLTPVRYQGYDRIWRIQDEMVKQIITNSQANNWNPPVYFAMTVAAENKLGLEDHLIMEGMALRVVELAGEDRIDTSVGQRIFGDPDHFRGIADPNVRKDDNDMRLVANYISAMFQIVEAYEKQGEVDSARRMAEAALSLRPSESLWQAYAYLARIYVRNSEFSKFDSLLSTFSQSTGLRICLAISQELIMNNDYEKASALLELALSRYPDSFTALNNLVVAYQQKGDTANAVAVMTRFREQNSQDTALMTSLDEISRRLGKPAEPLSEVK